MRKSMVLKDDKNLPRGYVVVSNAEIVCRARTDEPSKAVLFFRDGTRQTIQLSDGKEQRVDCAGKELAGCCVLCGGSIALASDDEVRRMYESKVLTEKKTDRICSEIRLNTPDDISKSNTGIKMVCCKEKEENKTTKYENAEVFVQRRWPPPPCWENACYRQGMWQEGENELSEKRPPVSAARL